MASDANAGLIKAYHETEYRVDDDPPLVLKIGEKNDGVRILFASFNVESAAFITAWNPRSTQLLDDENYDRQARLLEEIERLRLNYFVGRSEHPQHGWGEDSYLVLGVTDEQATALAHQFDQNGYIWVGLSGVPELVLLNY
ncbi:MAG TPA: DUF3293 domain-containing protein [Pseudomonadales bacterium]|nr:DUF3293 domain-containing protein [Pseudomonadales bacterium]